MSVLIRVPAARSKRRQRSPRRALLEFAVAGIATVAVVGGAGLIASHQAGEDEAVHDVEQLTQTLAWSVVSPYATEALIDGDPVAIAVLDAALASAVEGPSLLRVKVWSADGKVVYSDEERLIGSVFELDEHQSSVLREGGVVAEVSDLDGPENLFERDQGQLLEVYTALVGPDGDRMLFEAYYRAAAIDQAGWRIWRTFAPIVVGMLVLAELAHLLLAWRLARRLRESQVERELLLQRAIGASEAERRRIAADLHDGVVQDLAGLSFELSAAADRIEPFGDAELVRGLDSASAGARRTVQALRTLMVDIYPPNLEQRGLRPALADLLEPLAVRGIATELRVDGDLHLSFDVLRAVYRMVHEAVRNATKHASARTVTVSVRATDTSITVEVADDGVGFDARSVGETSGQLGLSLLRDLASSAGGDLTVESAPGTGTTVRMRVPR